MRTRSLIGNMVFGGFPKIIRNKIRAEMNFFSTTLGNFDMNGKKIG
jgi:hypothetical protein